MTPMSEPMTQDQLAAIRRLKELNAKRTPGEWHSINYADTWFAIQDGPDYDDSDLLKAGDDEAKKHVTLDEARANGDFIAALANACPGLLDAAERGARLIASGYTLDFLDQIEQLTAERDCLKEQLASEAEASMAVRVEAVRQVQASDSLYRKTAAERDAAQKLLGDLKAEYAGLLEPVRAERDAAVAERDRLRGLLVEWGEVLEAGTDEEEVGIRLMLKIDAEARRLAAPQAESEGER